MEAAATLARFLRPAPNAGALTMLGPHADQVGLALTGHDAQPRHPNEVRRRVRTHVFDHPRRPRDVPAVKQFEVLHVLEGVYLGEAQRDRPRPKAAPAGEHVICL